MEAERGEANERILTLVVAGECIVWTEEVRTISKAFFLIQGQQPADFIE